MKTLEERVHDLESLYGDMPAILTLRFERFEAAIAELTARLNLLERQMSFLLTEMRDLRGGVTRMLLAQDKEIADIKADVSVLKTDYSVLKADVSVLKADYSVLKADVGVLKSAVAELKSTVTAVDKKLDLILALLQTR